MRITRARTKKLSYLVRVLLLGYVFVTIPLFLYQQLQYQKISSALGLNERQQNFIDSPAKTQLAAQQNSKPLPNAETNFAAKVLSPKKSFTKLLNNGRRQDHFVYVKIEKTGSSTFSNIFSSFGYRHSLNMMMSMNDKGYLDSSETAAGISWDIGPDRNNPHLMEQHARYNHRFYHNIFPNNTVYLTSIRNPEKWFISYVDFMGAYRNFNPNQVLRQDELFFKTRAFSPINMNTYVHNNFLDFLGFDIRLSNDVAAIKAHIDFVDKNFLLVMITDYFDESLVLLKRLMNWSMADIFYSYANEARHRSGAVFTDEERNKLFDIEHNMGDFLLFQHFNKTFWNKVKAQQNFFEEVNVFRELNKKVHKFCFSDELALDKTLKLKMKTFGNEEIEFGDKDCLSIRVRNGLALEFSAALDKYCPFRGLLKKKSKKKPRRKQKHRNHVMKEFY